LIATVSNVNRDDITVVHQPEERRYELLVAGGHAGELVYRERDEGVLALLHTEVDQKRRQRGLGSALVAGALADVRKRGLRVVPICPFVDDYIRRHPKHTDLVVSDPARRR
jgi:predicted GNAT family acetyltransferase